MAFRLSVERISAPRVGMGNMRASGHMNSENVLEWGSWRRVDWRNRSVSSMLGEGTQRGRLPWSLGQQRKQAVALAWTGREWRAA